jgi:hypothetical protein
METYVPTKRRTLSKLHGVTTRTMIHFSHHRENLKSNTVVCLTTLSVTQTIYRQMIGWWRTINWKGCGRKRSWSNWMYYIGIFLEVLRKPTDIRVRLLMSRQRIEPDTLRTQVRSLSAYTEKQMVKRWLSILILSFLVGHRKQYPQGYK